MGKIAVIGSLNMDMVITSPKMPLMGETVMGGGFITSPGGKGANQAVAASRLGGDVAMAGCVGDDAFGDRLLENLRQSGVDVGRVRRLPGVSTGVAMIIVVGGDNTILVDPGANALLTPDMLDEDFIAACDTVMLQLEIPPETVSRAADIARRHGVRVLLNPAPARPLPAGLLAKADVLTPNETECGLMTGAEIASVGDAGRAIPDLLARGARNVIVTMGKNGAVYNDGDKIVHCPAPPVKAVDTTAAGDCFSAAVAVALGEGKSIAEAVGFACRAGALTVQKMGAQASLPWRDDLRS
ncbi:MAG: ribokinase [Firmicutes bacterium]|nr:ribokinase [Bacillota bacterium]